MVAIRRAISSGDAPVADLVRSLSSVVAGGASLGFHAPLEPAVAARYWAGVIGELERRRYLWLAEIDGSLVGSVQLVPADKENARHRAEIAKLFVDESYRGHGIAASLMETAERFALSIGRSHLVLDTAAGSVAERFYARLGWQKVGEIPEYFTWSNGDLGATALYYKILGNGGECG